MLLSFTALPCGCSRQQPVSTTPSPVEAVVTRPRTESFPHIRAVTPDAVPFTDNKAIIGVFHVTYEIEAPELLTNARLELRTDRSLIARVDVPIQSHGEVDLHAKAINANLKTFSLVHVLVYKFKTGPTFADLPNIPWNQTYKEMFVDESIKAKSLMARIELPTTFHFFAEPDTNVRQQQAFPCIVNHFSDVDLDVTETEPAHKTDWSTTLKGLYRWEQLGLLERSKLLHYTDCPSMDPLGHMPANCGTLFVDNRTSIL